MQKRSRGIGDYTTVGRDDREEDSFQERERERRERRREREKRAGRRKEPNKTPGNAVSTPADHFWRELC